MIDYILKEVDQEPRRVETKNIEELVKELKSNYPNANELCCIKMFYEHNGNNEGWLIIYDKKNYRSTPNCIIKNACKRAPVHLDYPFFEVGGPVILIKLSENNDLFHATLQLPVASITNYKLKKVTNDDLDFFKEMFSDEQKNELYKMKETYEEEVGAPLIYKLNLGR